MIFPIYKILLDFSVTRSRDERERETTGGYYQSFTWPLNGVPHQNSVSLLGI